MTTYPVQIHVNSKELNDIFEKASNSDKPNKLSSDQMGLFDKTISKIENEDIQITYRQSVIYKEKKSPTHLF